MADASRLNYFTHSIAWVVLTIFFVVTNRCLIKPMVMCQWNEKGP